MTNADYGAGFGDYRGYAPQAARGQFQGEQQHYRRQGQSQMGQSQMGQGMAASPATPHLSRAQRMVNIAGAVGSVALVASLAYWGWELAVRDVSGVPVVRAMEGPMRMAPERPSGMVVNHQGLSVNDVAARDGGNGSDSLRLAPAAVDLTEEDLAGLAVADVAMGAPGSNPADMVSVGGVPVTRMSAAEESPEPLEVAPEVMSAAPEMAGAGTAAPVISQDEAVALALAEALGMDDAASADLVAQAAPAPVGAMVTSPRPRPRPAALASAGTTRGGTTPGISGESVVQTSSAAAVGGRKDPATLEIGARLVQFGAFDSEAQAETEWQKIATRLGPLMAEKAMVVQSAESGGHTFWRLRGFGFASEDDARRFCSAAVAEKINCIPVTHR